MWKKVYLIIALYLVGAAQAATFNIANGDLAGLRAAIVKANATAAVDTISLAANGDYVFFDYDLTSFRTALPAITTDVIIEGNGAVLRRGNGFGWIPVPKFRMLRVDKTGSLTLRNTTVRDGDLTALSGYLFDDRGAGLLNEGITTLEQCRFENNSTGYSAAAVETTGPLFVSNSEFRDNTSSLGTGAITADNNGSLLIESCEFTDNSGANIIDLNHVANAEITRSSIFGGRVHGIFVDDSTLSVVNSTIAHAGSMGMSIYDSVVTVTHCTVTENGEPGWSGTGIELLTGDLSLRNSILAGNGEIGTTDEDLVVWFGFLMQNTGNLIGRGTYSGDFSADPKLGPLGYYGGSTQVYPLIDGSIAIDHANDLYSETVDQRGVARPVGAHADIGAYEGAILDFFKLITVNVIYRTEPYFIVCDPLGPVTIAVSILGSRTEPARSINADSLTMGNARAGSARVVSLADVNRDGVEDLTVEFQLTNVYRGALSCSDVSRIEMQGRTVDGKAIVGYVDVMAVAAR